MAGVGCTEHSRSCEANSYSACKEIPQILWNPSVEYVVKNQPPVLIPSQINPTNTHTLFYFSKTQINPVYPLQFYLFQSNINIIIQYTFWSSKRVLSFRFHQQDTVCLCIFRLIVSGAPSISVSLDLTL